jgi:hypothetical protein
LKEFWNWPFFFYILYYNYYRFYIKYNWIW